MNEYESLEPGLRRIGTALGVLLVACLIGALGFWWIGDGRWHFGDCLYFTIVTLSTVGFGETLDGMDTHPWARVWTIVLLVLGSGTLIYFASAVTAVLVEGDLRHALRRNRMRRVIDTLNGHAIVCGAGATGAIVIRELTATQTPFVVVERDAVRLETLLRDHPALLYIRGNAMEDEDLVAAGVLRASCVIAVLTDDRDNLMVTVTARALNERIRIVAKAIYEESHPKLRRAGADAVVSPNTIGGRRMVTEATSPSAARFLDELARDSSRRIDEVNIPATSHAVGRTLAALDLDGSGHAVLLAVRAANGHLVHHPPLDRPVAAQESLILLATNDDLAAIRARLT